MLPPASRPLRDRPASPNVHIYARWIGKPALFLAVLQRLIAGWLLTTDAWPETEDLATALHHAAHSILAVGLTPEAITLRRLMIAESARFPELQTIMAQSGAQEGVRRIAALLDRAMAAGTLRPVDTVFAAEQFLHLVLAGPQRRAMGLGPALDAGQLDAWAAASVRMFLSGCQSGSEAPPLVTLGAPHQTKSCHPARQQAD